MAGQVVVVELVEQPTACPSPSASIVEILGNYADPGDGRSRSRCASTNCPSSSRPSQGADPQAARQAVRKTDWKGREDITKLPLVTIDGETAKDFDDAVFCERQGRGFRLVVAIADVSTYVKPARRWTAKPSTAATRCISRAGDPDAAEKLSNGLCSLNPQVERLCMVCDMAISTPARSSSSASIRP